MFFLVIRKIIRNKWMVLCLLIGSILSVALISSIPMYTDAVLQRMLTKDLEDFQKETDIYPGRYYIRLNYNLIPEEKKVNAFHAIDSKIKNEMVKEINIPNVNAYTALKTSTLNLNWNNIYSDSQVSLETISGLKDHVVITHGRMFNNKIKDDILEVIATESLMQRSNIILGRVYTVPEIEKTLNKPFKIKVVGVCTVKDYKDSYWANSFEKYQNSIFTDYEIFHNEFIKSGSDLIYGSEWYYAFDYREIKLENLNSILKTYRKQDKGLYNISSLIRFEFPAIDYLKKYHEREKRLQTTLWVQLIPVFIVLSFYIFMVSQLIVENDRNQIAVLKSRGASRIQIFFNYFLESLILSGISLILGPPLGLFICRILGSANGFLEFVNRTALPVNMGIKAYIYSVWATLFFIIMTLIPVLIASGTTIVKYKQSIAGKKAIPIWQKYFLDAIFLGIAFYGLYQYHRQQSILSVSGVMGINLEMDHVLYLTTTLFILGAGMMFLRIYPYLVKFIFWLGKKIWSPVMYVSFIQVGRSKGREQFIMLFLIFAISVGINNAGSARTINNNMLDKIYYNTGTDITVRGDWGGGPDIGVGDDPSNVSPVRYIEPRFAPYTNLSGTEEVTKVFRKDRISARINDRSFENVYLMGITSHKFGKVAWFRNDLLNYHWYNYLNLLTESPMAVLVSSSIKKDFNVTTGDRITFWWNRQNHIEGIVYGFVDYWPTFNPNSPVGTMMKPRLIVANLSYIYSKTVKEPYEVWIRKKPGVSSTQVFNDMQDRKIQISGYKDASAQIIDSRNDPMLQGTNGALTLGFVSTMIISLTGFLIYWILSIRSRILQFGIFRAMGLTFGKLVSMLICEQILISGVAAFFGITLGGLACKLFVPLLQIVHSAAEQVPPFKVIIHASDYISIYTFFTAMMLAGLLTLSFMISKIKISQALKLGED